MIGSLAAAMVLATGASDLLDAPTLRTVMKTSIKAPSSEPLAGRPFRVVIPFVDGRKRDIQTFQSPARWTYDYRRRELKVIIGLGEISPANYDRFEKQGLKSLPPLQTAFFGGHEVHSDVFLRVYERDRNYSEQTALMTNNTNYGLAIPYGEGASALPPRFEPLMIYKVDMSPRGMGKVVKGMTLVLEGRLTSLGQHPEVFCGDYKGTLAARDTNDTVNLVVTSHQCFATARIDSVSVFGGDGAQLAGWSGAAR